MKKLFVIAAVLFFTSNLMAQVGALNHLDASHFARTMRLGNAYAGVAEGPETVFYNAAGLADINSYSVIASSGQGTAFYINNVYAYDISAAIPIGRTGTLGVSMNSFILGFTGYDDAVYRIYGLTYAYKFFGSLNIGLTGNYYHSSYENIAMCGPRTVTGSAFDINLSALYKTPVRIFMRDVLQIGFQFKNVMNRELNLNFNLNDQEHKLFQDMRAGLSYTLIPDVKPIYGFIPLKFMAAFDVLYKGSDYSFYEWQPNYGLELTILEVFQVSYGRENQEQLKTVYSYYPQHPVNRYGAGFRLPLERIFNMNNGLSLRFDYCRSDWRKIDEDAVQSPISGERIDVQEDAFSLGVTIDY